MAINFERRSASDMDRRLHSRTPELERNNNDGFMRYLEHGFPSPLIRWHCHDEYELHLIVASRGKLFVGDYIGTFAPGNLVLTGPRLPHNWISVCGPDDCFPLRDMVLQFAHAPLESAAENIPELREIFPLLDRSTYGVEFVGLGEMATARFLRIRESTGADRFVEFIGFLSMLARSTEYRLLSSARMQSYDDDASLAKINSILNYITSNYCDEISAQDIAGQQGMSLSKFSRFFSHATGNSFTDFVNRLRINKACQLLMNTDHYVGNVCYEVGFNNLANFNRRFLALKGITPKEFRRTAEERFGDQSPGTPAHVLPAASMPPAPLPT